MPPPKRKATVGNGRPAKRIASGVATPVSRGSDPEYDESEDMSQSEADVSHKYDSPVALCCPDWSSSRR